MTSEMCDRGFLIAVFGITSVEVKKINKKTPHIHKKKQWRSKLEVRRKLSAKGLTFFL